MRGTRNPFRRAAEPRGPSMAKYTVLPRRRQPGYKVELIDDDGSCRTILGFNSEAESEAWVQEDVT